VRMYRSTLWFISPGDFLPSLQKDVSAANNSVLLVSDDPFVYCNVYLFLLSL